MGGGGGGGGGGQGQRFENELPCYVSHMYLVVSHAHSHLLAYNYTIAMSTVCNQSLTYFGAPAIT